MVVSRLESGAYKLLDVMIAKRTERNRRHLLLKAMPHRCSCMVISRPHQLIRILVHGAFLIMLK